MAIYSFQTEGALWSNGQPIEVDLATLKDAQVEAVGFMGDALRNRPEKFWDYDGASVTVSDHTRLTLFTLTLSATLAPVLQPPPKPF